MLLAVLLLAAFTYAVTRFLRSLKIDPPLKNVLITGCDTGFGRLTAEYLYKLGWHVYANCLTESGAKELETECKKVQTKNGKLTTLIFSVSDEQAVKNALEQITKESPEGLYAVINNAGISRGAFVEFNDLSDYRISMEVNFFGMVAVTKYSLPLVRKAKGRIINMTSCAGRVASGVGTTYCASKFAGEAFSDGLRQEVTPFGVKVSIIEPGFMKTPLVVSGFERMQAIFDKNPDLVKTYSIPGGLPVTVGSHPPCGNPMQVVEAYYHALTSRFPLTRYSVGVDSKVVIFLASILPTWAMDKFLLIMVQNSVQKKGAKIVIETKKEQ